MYTVTAERLSETLELWRTFALSREVKLYETCDGNPTPFVYERATKWHTLQQLILDNTVSSLTPSDWLTLPTVEAYIPMAVRAYDTFPIELFEWNRKSRRIFKLNRSLEHTLAAATYRDLRWKDVKWPFDAFILELEEPIKIEDEVGVWAEYDCILVAKIRNRVSSYVNVRLFRKPHEHGQRKLSEDLRKQIDRALKSGDARRASLLMRRGMKAVLKGAKTLQGIYCIPLHSEDPESANTPVRISAEDILRHPSNISVQGHEENRWRAENMSIALKLVVGFCLYLRTISSSQLQIYQPSGKWRHGTKGSVSIITSPEHICDVVGQGTIDPSAYDAHRLGSEISRLFVRPHWRRGHDRRLPGSPPNAPKTVQVPPKLIREDLIPLFGIVGGSKTTILPEE